jgi:hypothetical protein
MLVNAAEGFRATGRIGEAREVSLAALERPPDNGTPLHRLWLASDASGGGDAAAAAALIEQVDPAALDADYQFLYACVAAVVDLAAAPASQRSATFRAALSRLRKARREYAALAHEPARRRVLRRSILQLGRLHGAWWARTWAAMEWLLTF